MTNVTKLQITTIADTQQLVEILEKFDFMYYMSEDKTIKRQGTIEEKRIRDAAKRLNCPGLVKQYSDWAHGAEKPIPSEEMLS